MTCGESGGKSNRRRKAFGKRAPRAPPKKGPRLNPPKGAEGNEANCTLTFRQRVSCIAVCPTVFCYLSALGLDPRSTAHIGKF